jgi:hypothetical protein
MHAGCGDGPICPSELVAIINAPTDGAELTTSLTDVTVRSNLKKEGELTLIITGPSGTGELTAKTDENGNATFSDVNLPSGAVKLQLSAQSECGTVQTETAVNVFTEVDCTLSLSTTPQNRPFYAPLLTLNASNDGDAANDLQTTVHIATAGDFAIELYRLDGNTGAETKIGSGTANADGKASFPVTLPQGRQTLRASCTSPSGRSTAASGPVTFQVDTAAPSCSLTAPTANQAITPNTDSDANPGNGVQAILGGHSDSDDTRGEPTTFVVEAETVSGSTVDATGDAQVEATFSSPGNKALRFRVADHAGNQCTSAPVTVGVDIAGCSIAHLGPLPEEVLKDENPSLPGLQTTLELQVATACQGQHVTTTCDISGSKQILVPSNGSISEQITLCNVQECSGARSCSSLVTSPLGVTTLTNATLNYDTLPPFATLLAVSPTPLPCGGAVTPSVDVDPSTVGVQVRVSFSAIAVHTLELETTSASGTTKVPATHGTPMNTTIEPGDNNLVAIAGDEHGNTRRTPDCQVKLADIAVNFTGVVADRLLTATEGTVSGSDLLVNVCGTVSHADSTIDVRVDNGPAYAATVTGQTWCAANVPVPSGNHVIKATATKAALAGEASVPVLVDFTPPSAPAINSATPVKHNAVTLSWNAVAGAASYILKWDTQPITDFASVTQALSLPATGGTESTTINQLRAGSSYWFAVAALDENGNVSAPGILGPADPAYTASGAAPPPTTGTGPRLGRRLTRGDFNNDGHDDIAISAPRESMKGRVYVYLGGPYGLADSPGGAISPDIIISNTPSTGRLGWGITAIDWNGDGVDDLAAADFIYGSGRVYIFHGGANFEPATTPPKQINETNANVIIDATGGWFSGASIGYSLTAVRFDGDNRDDLVISAHRGGGNTGGVVILFGGATSTNIGLSDVADTMGDAVAYLIKDPNQSAQRSFGFLVHNLGKTRTSDPGDSVGITEFVSNNTFFVWRGRSTKPVKNDSVPGSAVVTLPFDNTRDLEVTSTLADTETNYGWVSGSVPGASGRNIVLTAMSNDTTAGSNNHDGVAFLINGQATGVKSLTDVSLAQITPEAGVVQFGSAVANNADALSADIDADGLEDLVIGGGRNSGNVSLFVWYGGLLPSGSTTTASAQHRIIGPAEFQSTYTYSQDPALLAVWAGDVDGDGLEDLCWADNTALADIGTFELLHN